MSFAALGPVHAPPFGDTLFPTLPAAVAAELFPTPDFPADINFFPADIKVENSQQKSDLHRLVPKPGDKQAESVEKKRVFSKFARDVALGLAYVLIALAINLMVIMLILALKAAHLKLALFVILATAMAISGAILSLLIIISLDRAISTHAKKGI